MIGISGTFAINGNRGRATLRCVQSIHRIDSQLGRYLDINSAWRDPVEQERLYNAYRRDPKNNPIALAPENSVHCKGEAIDTDDSARVALLNRNGWFQTVYRIENGVRVLKEPWHFEYDQARDNFYGGVPAGGQEEDDMPYSEEQLSRIIRNAVYGIDGEPAYRPMILNRSSGQKEYPELTIGGLQKRIKDEVVAQATAELKNLIEARANDIAQHVTRVVNEAINK